jgi:hypothetical protein
MDAIPNHLQLSIVTSLVVWLDTKLCQRGRGGSRARSGSNRDTLTVADMHLPALVGSTVATASRRCASGPTPVCNILGSPRFLGL